MTAWLRNVAIGMLLALAFGLLLGQTRGASARDVGQWEASDPAIREWYRSLMQPDNPTASCCGTSDAYFADEIHVKDGKTYATITDDRPDEPLGRPHIDVGTVIEIPPQKLKWDGGNPSGHNVLFLSRGGFVFCLVTGTLI
jgi:hypothetical protein